MFRKISVLFLLMALTPLPPLPYINEGEGNINASELAVASPKVNAEGLNMNAFGAVKSGKVDLASGTFSMD